MDVSVVICTYSLDLYSDLTDAIESVRNQTYDEIEVVVIVDGNETLYDRLHTDWADVPDVIVDRNEENKGLSASRNRGIAKASGDIIAFMDDDAVADPAWIEELVTVYEQQDVEAVGGKMTPIWVAGEPTALPAEFYWLVGVTHRGFPDKGPVRNTFGSNISFRNDVLEQLGGFNENLGRKGDQHVQGEETELAARLRAELDGTVYYTPAAKVGHKVFEYRLDNWWLLKRAFWQGYSKRVMARLLPTAGTAESRFLRQLLVQFIPQRFWKIFHEPRRSEILQLIAIVLLTGAVGLGYGYAMAKELVDRAHD